MLQRLPMVERLRNAVCKLERLLADREKAYDRIERDYPDQYLKMETANERRDRIALVKKTFDKDWLMALDDLNALCKAIRKRQPRIAEMGAEILNTTLCYPDAIAWGRMRLRFEDLDAYVPKLLRFPFEKAFFDNDTESARQTVYRLFLRLLYCLPVGKVKVTVVDPMGLGQAIKPFLGLLKSSRLFPEGKALVYSDEIDKALTSLADGVEHAIQDVFQGKIGGWTEYNAIHRDKSMPYKVLLVFGCPAQFSASSVFQLQRLLEWGPRCGVLPIILMGNVDSKSLDEKNRVLIQDALNANAIQISNLGKQLMSGCAFENLKVDDEDERWPNNQRFEDLISAYAKADSGLRSRVRLLKEMLPKDDQYMSFLSCNGIKTPLGWNEDGDIAELELGAVHSQHHVLVAGSSGSGKSNVLNVIVHGFCSRYSPEELSMYILDYKQGVGAISFINPPLPHAKVVATKADVEFGLTVINHLRTEIDRRSELFKDTGVADFAEYRKKGASLARAVLIIDEFQVLFEDDPHLGREIEKGLTQLFRQGRSYGIHVILLTQTLKGIQAMSMSQLISQIGCRIALACTEEDSAQILCSNNWAAAELHSPPEAIINNSRGAKSANVKFNVPLANDELCAGNMKLLDTLCCVRGLTNNPKIFNGDTLPIIPTMAYFGSHLASSELLIGQTLGLNSEELRINIAETPKTNILIAGAHRRLRHGLFASILRSAISGGTFDEVLVVNGSGEALCREDLESIKNCNREINVFEPSDVNWEELVSGLGGKKRAIVILSFERIKDLQSQGFVPRIGPANTKPTNAQLFKTVVEEGPRQGTCVFAFVDVWKRCNVQGNKETLQFFDRRIAFGMNEDDAGSFVLASGYATAKIKGLDSECKALYCDLSLDKRVWFQPYILKDEEA